MIGFRIGGEDSEYLDVKIIAPSDPTKDYWDGNWVVADIEIEAGGFSGRYRAYLRAEELKSFRNAVASLYSLDSKEARFETMEGQLRINIVGDNLGHFEAECEALDQVGSGNRLSFSLSFDQTYLPGILKGLDTVVRECPVVGQPAI